MATLSCRIPHKKISKSYSLCRFSKPFSTYVSVSFEQKALDRFARFKVQNDLEVKIGYLIGHAKRGQSKPSGPQVGPKR